MAKKELSVGELSRRSGLPVSTLHFYERSELIASERTSANHRVYRREILRRVTVIKIAQSAGIPLAEIAEALSQLPRDTSPDTTRLGAHRRKLALRSHTADRASHGASRQDGDVHWLRMSERETLPLVNANDHLAKDGPGARLL